MTLVDAATLFLYVLAGQALADFDGNRLIRRWAVMVFWPIILPCEALFGR